MREEVSFTKGRVIVRGKMVSRGAAKRADYILYYKANIPLAVIEAKDNNCAVGERIQRLKPAQGDLLYSREGGILGIACRVPADVDLCLGQRMMLIRAAPAISPDFLEVILNSPLITELARTNTTGGAAPRINVATVKAYPIPVPPLDAQRRIVAKLKELMVICDLLEARINAGETANSRLLEALLQDALQSPKETVVS